MITPDNGITLYHGSKSGITGRITPCSRRRCDFGQGFYMGTGPEQPLTLICNYPGAKLYTLRVHHPDSLRILDLKADLGWALLVAYNRGRMDSAVGTALYRRISELSAGYDMIFGYIANDRMFVVLDRFFNGDITDQALIHSLCALKLGKQYAAITQKACDCVEILQVRHLTSEDRSVLKRESEANRASGIALADEICRQYRREGRYFDEIITD